MEQFHTALGTFATEHFETALLYLKLFLPDMKESCISFHVIIISSNTIPEYLNLVAVAFSFYGRVKPLELDWLLEFDNSYTRHYRNPRFSHLNMTIW